ncbi:MAG: TolC family protein [Alphaproteobacteria bacterium]|nr:TolC family protein [Alphaproteobacteria bacterium]
MPKIHQKKIVWLLCATILSSQPVFAQDAAKPETNNTPAAVAAVPQKITGFTLDDAIAKALLQSPRLKGFNSGVSAAKGEERQAGAWVNPEVGVEAENVAGQGAYKGFDSAEVTYGVTQEITIGGKISAREGIAGKGVEIASLEAQGAALDVIRDVTSAYADVVAAEENVRLATEQKELAEDVLKSVSVRVGAAAAPLIQKSRAEVERSTATIALDKAIRERDITRKKLASLMGEEAFTLPLDTTAFFAITKPELPALEEKLKANPDILKLNSSLEQSKARLDLEQANAIPDPRLSVGVRDFRDSGDQAFLVGVSLPIPVFNANRGNIEKARSDVSRAELDNRQMVLDVGAELTSAHERMQNAYVQAETLKTEILPSADKAFRLAREGYGSGRFPYLEVLDAQRSLFGVKQQRIEAIREFHSAKAQVERLTAIHLGSIKNTGQTHVE